MTRTPPLRLRPIGAFALFVFVACGGGTGGSDPDTGDGEDASADVSVDPGTLGETGIADASDIPFGDTTGPGDVGDRCERDGDCLSLLCLVLDSASAGVCSQPCEDLTDCPVGWNCVLFTDAGTATERCVPNDLCIDDDEDGYGAGSACMGPDCDDGDPNINPAAGELCDGIDNDCDSIIDDFPIDANQSCEAGEGDTCGEGTTLCRSGSLDCVPRVIPADEVCDGVDNDCDGNVDEEAPDARTWYLDLDADGFGDADAPTQFGCSRPDGYSSVAGDCNDSDERFFPGAPGEDCGSTDDFNCDGSTGTVDNDNDGFLACEECNDASAVAYPGGMEVCDGLDNDCDGQIDVGFPGEDGTCETGETGICGVGALQCIDAVYQCVRELNPGVELCDDLDNDCDGEVDEDTFDSLQFFADTDGDGYGDPENAVQDCAPPEGYVGNSLDCNDGEGDDRPGGAEVCDGRDNDCDGMVDEGDPGGGDACDTGANGICAAGTTTCVTGMVVCSANLVQTNEICDGLDNDCDGTTDEDAAPATYYRDADMDGVGTDSDTMTGCDPPSGYVAIGGDCNDGDANNYPGNGEVCDGADNDCDGTVDNGNPGGGGACSTGQDGVCAAGTETCSGGGLTCVSNTSSSAEICDGLDNDCDGVDDEEPTDGTTYYRDADMDGYGVSNNTIVACSQPAGYAPRGGDCRDGDPDSNEGATEICDGFDNDCDGTPDDGNPGGGGECATGLGGVCETGVLSCSGGSLQCDAVPDGIEICNGRDDDCDGRVDEGAFGTTRYYADRDLDGYGADDDYIDACDPRSRLLPDHRWRLLRRQRAGVPRPDDVVHLRRPWRWFLRLQLRRRGDAAVHDGRRSLRYLLSA